MKIKSLNWQRNTHRRNRPEHNPRFPVSSIIIVLVIVPKSRKLFCILTWIWFKIFALGLLLLNTHLDEPKIPVAFLWASYLTSIVPPSPSLWKICYTLNGNICYTLNWPWCFVYWQVSLLVMLELQFPDFRKFYYPQATSDFKLQSIIMFSKLYAIFWWVSTLNILILLFVIRSEFLVPTMILWFLSTMLVSMLPVRFNDLVYKVPSRKVILRHLWCCLDSKPNPMWGYHYYSCLHQVAGFASCWVQHSFRERCHVTLGKMLFLWPRNLLNFIPKGTEVFVNSVL